MNYLEYMRRINLKFEQGIIDGRMASYRPGLIFGSFRSAYNKGYKAGDRVRELRQNGVLKNE